jgi:hypothetical protein
MVSTPRLSTVAVLVCVGLAGCGMAQSSSTGAPPQTAQAQTGYIVPPGYVSGQRIIPYTGRVATKCDHHTSEVARDACIKLGG